MAKTQLPVPIPIESALALIAAQVLPLAAEPVDIDDALGRVLADDVSASIDLPSFPSSAMDGFAFRAADTPGTLRLAGESAAGHPHGAPLGPGTAIAISTGAVVPDGADSVIPVEESTVRDGALEISEGRPAGRHVRRPGSDVCAGSQVLAAGTTIGAAQIGAAAAIGLRALPCRRVPRTAVLSTGSELRPPGEPLRDGEIYDSNAPMLHAALRSAGAHSARIAAVADTPQAHQEALARALEHDVVITTGGVSVGEHDLVRRSADALGIHEMFWRVALRPGKPMWFGVRGATLVFGLPGNPVSALVCFELFVRPALRALQGAPFAPAFRRGMLGARVGRNRERDELIRVRISREAWLPDAAPDVRVPTLTPVTGQQSHQIAVTAGADGLARIPAGSGELPAGAAVAYLPLQ
jgi:molybdopterin molybdotransferase